MKKYVFLILTFLICLFCIHNVYAATLPGWGYDKLHPSYADITDCSSASCVTSLNTQGQNIDNSNYFYHQGNYTSMSANGEGVMWTYLLDYNISSNYLYSVSTYICHQSTANLVNKMSYSAGSVGGVQDKSHPVTVYYQNQINGIEPMPFNNSSTYTKCGVLTTIFRPSVSSTYYGINYTLASSSSNYTGALIGYEINTLGLATQLSQADIQNVINSSGLASANDISGLQSSISSIQSSINNNIDQAESNIINSQEQTRDAIINNQNENTNKEIESQKVCKDIDKNLITTNNSFLTQNGSIGTDLDYGITSYININKATLKLLTVTNTANAYFCFYNTNRSLISCVSSRSNGVGDVTIPSGAYYFRASIIKSENKPTFRVCQDGNQAMNDSINNVNDTLNDSDSSGASGQASSFFSNFTTNTHGLTGIITAPLSAIQNLINNTCTPLVLPLPFVNRNLTLPCLSTIYSNYFGTFFTMYQTITLGIVSYWVLVRIFALVKDFKNPEHDEIEVVEL